MLNVRFSTVSVIAFVSNAVKVPRNVSGAGDEAMCFLTAGVCAAAAGGVGTAAAGGGGVGTTMADVLVLSCAQDGAGTARMAAAHKVSIESFAMCIFILVEDWGFIMEETREAASRF